MTIYQLHEISSEFSDYTDRIIGSYMRRQRAKEEKVKREKELVVKNTRIRHCMFCPYLDSWYKDNIDKKELIDKMTEYCDHGEIVIDEDGVVICKEYAECIFDDGEFYIEKVEVEE